MSRILLVDDEAAAVAGLRALLELDGHVVTALRSSEQAAELLGREAFDIVITDLEMPVVHGTQLVRIAIASRPAAIVLVVTGYADSPASRDALAAGARRVFDKPLDYDALTSALAEVGAG